jgi:hypothetical protein
MKTLGRIIIILAAFALVMGITYGIVNAVSSSTVVRSFERGGEGSHHTEGVQPQLPNGQRPEFPGGESHEGRGGGSIVRLLLGTLKNIGLVALVVVLVVWLKDHIEKRKREAQKVTE